MNKIRSFALALAMAFSFNAFADGDELVVGIEASSEPFVIIDPKTHDYVGYDIDLIKAVAKEAGYKSIKFHDMPFDAMFADVLVEQVDCAISMITITEERALIWDFIGPYFNTGLDIMLNKKYQKEFKRDSDLHDVTICAKTSSTCEAYALGMSDIQVLSLDSEKKLFDAANEGKCDGVITNEPILQYYLKVSPDRDKFYRLGRKLTFAQFGIMTSKNRPDISERLSQALEKVMKTPYFNEIYRKWFE